MKTKAEIVKTLLDAKKIDVEEAMILMDNSKEVHYIQTPIPNHYLFSKDPYQPPFTVTCNSSLSTFN
jgi:hypothetical protein